MLDERSAFVERKDETHDPNGFAIFSKDLLKELVRHYYLSLFTTLPLYAAELQRKDERTALKAAFGSS